MSFKEQEEFLDNVLEKIDNLLGGMCLVCQLNICECPTFLLCTFSLFIYPSLVTAFYSVHHASRLFSLSCSLKIDLICKYWLVGNRSLRGGGRRMYTFKLML